MSSTCKSKVQSTNSVWITNNIQNVILYAEIVDYCIEIKAMNN
jgi:hypothetical protein